MVITKIFFWWYSRGWQAFIVKIRTALSNIIDFFSMSSLLRTLFKPYRQISAESASSSSSLDVKFRLMIDRLISRVVGFFSRLILLIAGTVTIILGGIFSLILIIVWPIVPLLPIAGIILSMIGFTI